LPTTGGRTALARILTMAALVAAAGGVALLVLGGSRAYRVHAILQNAGQLVRGNLVTVGGVSVGSVTDIELDSRNQADITLRIDDHRFVPLHRGTTATVRVGSLSSVAGRDVALSPGPNDASPLPDGAQIDVDRTQSVVELDSVIDTVDAQTRSALQDIIHGSAASYADRTAQANQALLALDPALSQTAATTSELLRDQGAFERVIIAGAGVAQALASRRGDLEGTIANGAITAQALASRSNDLDAILRRSPALLRRANTTLVDLRFALADLRPTLRLARPVAPRLARGLRDAAPVVRRAVPVVDQLAALLPDAARAIAGLPTLQQRALPAFSNATGSLAGTAPILAALRPYVPDVVAGFFNGFGGTVAGYYDANGHYARISLQGNGYSLAGGTSLVPLPPGNGGAFSGYRTGLLARCPGAAAQPAPDRSNPFVTPEAPCTPSDTP